ncbi:hypothetical protein LA59_12365 [Vibrio harveyi]|nr:hypothetical protein LA59_12365 [Vibrio harveyi]
MSKNVRGDDVEALRERDIKFRQGFHGQSPKSLSTRGVLLLLSQQALRPLLQPKASLVLKWRESEKVVGLSGLKFYTDRSCNPADQPN